MGSYSFCQSVGLEFVTIDTYEEQSDFLRLCTENSQYINPVIQIGVMTTTLRSNDWFWIHSGEKSPFPLRFAAGQPNNGGGLEYCGHIQFISGKFDIHDSNCYSSSLYSFACQEIMWYPPPSSFQQISFMSFLNKSNSLV